MWVLREERSGSVNMGVHQQQQQRRRAGRGNSNERRGEDNESRERMDGKDARSRRKQKGVAELGPNRHVRHPVIYSRHLT